MTAINTSLNNHYTSLNYQTNAQATSAPQTSLANILSQPNEDAITDSSAYKLDLSPDAQAYLKSKNAKATIATTPNLNFTLTAPQQETVNNIIAKYKNAPFTKDNFKAIQTDLKAARLGTDQLSAEDQIKSFDSKKVLMGFLDGATTSATPVQTANDEKIKSENFLQDVLNKWKSVSTTVKASDLKTISALAAS